MDPTRKVTIIKDKPSSERKTKSTSDTLKNPKPGTSKSTIEAPESPTAKKERQVKRMCLNHNMRKATPEELEGIMLQTPVDDAEKNSPGKPKDDDVLIIDMSKEEIAEILNGHSPLEIDDDLEELPICLYTEDGDVGIIPEILEKTPDEDPARFDVIDLTEDDDDDLEEERENLHARLVDKYVEGLAEERLSPDFKGYMPKSLRLSKPTIPQGNPQDSPIDLTKENPEDNPEKNREEQKE